MLKVPNTPPSCNPAAHLPQQKATYHNALTTGFLPESAVVHFLQEVKLYHGRRFPKEVALCSFALDVHKGKRCSVREYARIWKVPRSTVQDWIPRLIEQVIELINRFEGVDKEVDRSRMAANPDTPAAHAVDNSPRESVPAGSKRRWSVALQNFLDRIRTHTDLLFYLVVNRGCGKVDTAPVRPPHALRELMCGVIYTRAEAMEVFRRVGNQKWHFGRLFQPVRGPNCVHYLPRPALKQRIRVIRQATATAA